MKKILIVDDEPNNRILLQEILEDFKDGSFQLFYAADGAEALNIVQVEKPDLMFLDIMLPDIDGLEICRRIKATPDFEAIFIVILTALSQDSDRIMADGVSDMYITKPFKKAVVEDAVCRVFGCSNI